MQKTGAVKTRPNANLLTQIVAKVMLPAVKKVPPVAKAQHLHLPVMIAASPVQTAASQVLNAAIAMRARLL